MTFKLDQFFLYLTLISVIFNFSPLAAQNTDMSPTPLTPKLDITPPENIKSANEKSIPIIILAKTSQQNQLFIDPGLKFPHFQTRSEKQTHILIS